MIADTARRLFAQAGYPAAGGDVSGPLRELGLAGMAFSEVAGGMDAGAPDWTMLVQEAGRAAVLDPFVFHSILPAVLLRRCKGAEALAAHVAQGDTKAAIAVASNNPGGGGMNLPVRARPDGDTCFLTGRLDAVPGADTADIVIVPVAVEEQDQTAWFAVPTDISDITIKPFTMVDGRGAADIVLCDTELGPRDRLWADGDDILALLHDAGALALAADALGALEALRDLTLDHIRTRNQFGRAIGTFQVVQHHMVDIAHEAEHFASLVRGTALMFGTVGMTERARMVSTLKRTLTTRVRPAAATAVQLHGGIGVTAEYSLSRFVKRLLVDDMLFGNGDWHAARLRYLLREEIRQGETMNG